MIYIIRSQKQSKENYFQTESYTRKSFTTTCQNLQDHRNENIKDRDLRFFHKHSSEKIIIKFNC